MTRIFILFLFFFNFAIAYSQNPIWLQNEFLDSNLQSGKSLLGLKINGAYNSNFLTNNLLDKFLFGGTINKETKDKSRSKLQGKNYLNLEFESSVQYYCNIDTFIKNPKIGLYFGASIKGISSAQLNDDLFNLVFYGNKPFGENKILLNNNNYYQNIYQSLQLGIFSKKSLSFISLNIYNGSKLLDLTIEDGLIETKYDEIQNFLVPQQIDLSYNLNYAATQGKTNLFKSKGMGFGISGAYNFPLKLIKDKVSILKIEFEDLGFIKWHRGINTADTTGKFTFNGFESVGLFNFDNALLDANNIIDSILPAVDQESKLHALPTRFVVSLNSQWSKKIYTGLKVFYRYNCQNNYGAEIALSYALKENFLLGGALNVFGFIDPNLMVDASWVIKRNLLISANILNPIGFVNKNHTSKGCLIKLCKTI
jgi:Family of unknown function (DUF5723)